MPGRRVSGADFFDVYDAASEAVARARSGGGPSLLYLTDFERFYPHEQGISDAMRPPAHLEWIKQNRDPIKLFVARVTKSRELSQSQLDAIDEDIKTLVEAALAAAKVAPAISADHLLTDVYASY
jgi:pyruvate dehydrogenase E1 component alpha subunit